MLGKMPRRARQTRNQDMPSTIVEMKNRQVSRQTRAPAGFGFEQTVDNRFVVDAGSTRGFGTLLEQVRRTSLAYRFEVGVAPRGVNNQHVPFYDGANIQQPMLKQVGRNTIG